MFVTSSSLRVLTSLQITPAFVREAYSLLRQSIIHVEKDDVEMGEEDEDEDDDAPPPGEDGDQPMGDAPPASSQAGPSSPSRLPTPAPAPKKKKKVTVSYEKYTAMANLLLTHLSNVERDTNAGLPRSEVVQWYLEQREIYLNTLEELEEEQVLIDKVLTKLVKVRTMSSKQSNH